MVEKLVSSVRAKKGPKATAAVTEAVRLYAELWGNYAPGTDRLRHDLSFLIERFSDREADAYYDAIQRVRQEKTQPRE